MNASVSPDELTAENELICEKLLGWIRCLPGSKGARHGCTWSAYEDTPSFTTWADAGLILDELQRRSYDARGAADVLVELGDKLIGALLTPAAIRDAALKYTRSLP